MIEQVAGDIRYWHLTDLPVLHDHVRLARQSGNHLNLLSISADDPSATSADKFCRMHSRRRCECDSFSSSEAHLVTVNTG
jgi:hypothetical protein